MKHVTPSPFADPEVAMRKLLEIASTIEPVQDGRIPIEKINGPFLFEHGGKPAEYSAGLKLAIEGGFLWKHESGTYVKFMQAGRNCSLDVSKLKRPPHITSRAALPGGSKLR